MDEELPPELKRLYWKGVFLSYLVDFLVIAVLFIPSVLAPFIRPYQRSFTLTDQTIAFPFTTKEMVPGWALPIICFGVPAAIVLLRMAVERFKRPRLILAILGILVSIALTDFITNVVKNLLGRLRPDFLARCLPKVDEAGNIFCQQVKKNFLEEGRRSFPSGHASTCFAGLGFASIFLAGQFKIYDGTAPTLKLSLSFLPILGAMIVAVTRVLDYRHHLLDVVVGSFLGLGITLATYFMYFPSLFDGTSDEPIAIKRLEMIKSRVLEERGRRLEPACPA